GEAGARKDGREDEHGARAAAIRESADGEGGEASEEEIQRDRRGDGAAAPAKGLGEDGKEDPVGRERRRDAVGDDEERRDDQPTAGGRTRAEGADSGQALVPPRSAARELPADPLLDHLGGGGGVLLSPAPVPPPV